MLDSEVSTKTVCFCQRCGTLLEFKIFGGGWRSVGASADDPDYCPESTMIVHALSTEDDYVKTKTDTHEPIIREVPR